MRDGFKMSKRGQPSDISVGPFYMREGGHLLIDAAQAPSAEAIEVLQVQYAYEQGRLAERATIAARRRFRSGQGVAFHRSAWLGWLILLTFISWACFIGWLLQAVLTR